MYYESHITIEPVFDDVLTTVTQIAGISKFKVAKLLMKKRKEDTEERSQYDTFMTGHSDSYESLAKRMNDAIHNLQHTGIKVWRYKIEHVVLDSRIDDELNLLIGE